LHVIGAHYGSTTIARLLCGLILAAMVLSCVGCGAAHGTRKLTLPFGNSKEQELRKRVEADPFPSVKRAGL
jgi:hypothetical protein